MKNRLFIKARTLIVISVFFALSLPISFSIENRAIMNPAGSSTVPQSSIQSGLISNPNPFDTSGNLIITGNVRRGSHFRDTVSYGSTTSFTADLGSSSLSSFLRDSAGAEDFGRYAGKYRVQPYYLRSQTVTTTRPGYSGVFRQTDTKINERTLQSWYQAGMRGTGQGKQILSGDGTSTQAVTSQRLSDLGLQGPPRQYSTSAKPRLIVQSIRELQLLTRDEADKSLQDQQLMTKRYQKQTQDPTQDSRPKTQDLRLKPQDPGKALEQKFVLWSSEQKQNPVGKYELSKLFSQSQVSERVQPTKSDFDTDALTAGKDFGFQDRATLQKATGWELQADEGKVDEHGRDLQGLGSDVLERIKQQLDDLIRSVDARMQAGTDGQEKSRFGFPETPKPVRSEPFWQTGGSLVQTSNGANRGSYRERISPLDELNNLSQADLSARARRIRGPHSSAGSYSEARFNQHIQTAQGHLKAGRYYAAADSFALASIYKLDPGEAGSDAVQADGLALCLAGRGHALFAAGEYVSSALFLSRALKIAPEYAQTKIDLADMLGGQNKLESRIADIKEWVERSGSGKLEFLLGYVYYRMGRLGLAKQAIEAAYTKMPQSPAVVAVKKAIDDSVAEK